MAKYASEGFVCIVTGKPGADLHHVKTRKSGGPDEPWNLLSVSHDIHNEIHAKGLYSVSRKYPQIRAFLINHGWEFDAVLLKWVRPQFD